MMNIREANTKDIESIASLYITNWKKTYINLLPDDFLNGLTLSDGIKKWQEYIFKEKHKIFVAYENEKLLGFSACKEDEELKNTLYLDSLHVLEASRGRGVGTKLIKVVGNHAYVKGYKHMSICIVKGNDNAKRIYEKVGAKHYKDFIDNFRNVKCNSEKLIWNDLNCFK